MRLNPWTTSLMGASLSGTRPRHRLADSAVRTSLRSWAPPFQGPAHVIASRTRLYGLRFAHGRLPFRDPPTSSPRGLGCTDFASLMGASLSGTRPRHRLADSAVRTSLRSWAPPFQGPAHVIASRTRLYGLRFAHGRLPFRDPPTSSPRGLGCTDFASLMASSLLRRRRVTPGRPRTRYRYRSADRSRRTREARPRPPLP